MAEYQPSSHFHLNMVNTVDAFGPELLKHYTTTRIWEEVVRLQNCIRAYEEQILHWRNEISHWLSHKNRLIDVAKLPDDVLVNIWSYSAENSNLDEESFRHWINITHVSSCWRKIALETPTLWRWPFLLSPKKASALLPRAGNSTIHLKLDVRELAQMGPERIIRAFDLAGRLLCRAASLDLESFNAQLPVRDAGDPVEIYAREDFIERLEAPGALNKLKSLDLLIVDELDDWQTLDIVGWIKSAQGLRSLSLANVSILDKHSRLGILHNLTTLEIGLRDQTLGGIFQTPLPQVVSTLHLLPNLQDLTLFNVLRPSGDRSGQFNTQVAHSNPLMLNSLKELYLASEINEINAFLHHVGYTLAASVNLDVNKKSAASAWWTRGVGSMSASPNQAVEAVMEKTLDRLGSPLKAHCGPWRVCKS